MVEFGILLAPPSAGSMGPTPDDAITQLRPIVDLGVAEVTLYFWDVRSLDVFARKVIPALT